MNPFKDITHTKEVQIPVLKMKRYTESTQKSTKLATYKTKKNTKNILAKPLLPQKQMTIDCVFVSG